MYYSANTYGAHRMSTIALCAGTIVKKVSEFPPFKEIAF